MADSKDYTDAFKDVPGTVVFDARSRAWDSI